MDSTVLVAFIAVSGTIGSAGLTYFASLHNVKAQIKTSEMSLQAQLESVRLEVKKAEASQGEKLRNARERLYLSYLNALYDWEYLLLGTSFVPNEEAANSLAKTYRERFNELILLGTEQVKKRAEAMDDLLGAVLDEADVRGEFEEDRARLSAALDHHEDRWKIVRRALLDAMHEELKLSER
ncbi:MAG TPA: hypothetical protein VIP57_03940 [Candidatus Dormibacteraeota bacterium]